MLCGDLFLRFNGLVEGKAYQKKTYDLASNMRVSCKFSLQPFLDSVFGS